MGNWLGFAGFILAIGAGAVWFRKMQAVEIPAERGVYVAAFALAAGLGVASFAVGNGMLGGLAAGVAIALGGTMVLLRALSGHDDAPMAVRVGGPILDFSAPDENGEPFALASLRGRPYLLKFFRGHW